MGQDRLPLAGGPDGPNRSILTYECRTATADPVSRAQMSRYWWLPRPFVGYVHRAVLRTIRAKTPVQETSA